MNTDLIKAFSKAELEHLREKAKNANMAIAMHNEFVEFLRTQHEAPERDGWLLGAMGFEMMQEPEKPPLASVMDVTSEGVNGIVSEELEQFG